MALNYISAAEAASLIKHGYNIGLSGFTPAGTAKAVTAELAKIAEAEHAKGNPFQIGIFTGASTGDSCDGILSRAKAIRYRAPYTTNSDFRKAVNNGEIAYNDIHLSQMAQEVRYGFMGKVNIAIIEACEEKGLKAKIEYGEAAFYGPKLDFMVKDAIGRRWQLGTIQVDYNLPERFQMEYTGADNQKHRPVMVHRAPFGSMERFVAVLIEHTAGKFPLWLTPDQVAILPISEKFNDYAHEVKQYLKRYDIRAIVDERNEKIGRKIRDNEMKRIPYMLVVGEKEAENKEVAVRKQGEGDKGTMKFEEFAKKMNEEVQNMINKW